MTRALDKVLVGDGCWEWIAAKHSDGYGMVSKGRDGTGHVFAHRLFYGQFRGPITGDLQVDHLCRNRACVRPSHLELVTSIENTRRGRVARAQVRK